MSGTKYPGSFVSASPAETSEVGRRVGLACTPGTVLALIGDLGAGKTHFTKGLATGLGIDEKTVTSPTFVLMNEHQGRLRLFHIDAYRLDDPEEAFAAGLLDERQASGVTVVEWADRLDGWLPDQRIDIRITPVSGDDRGRRIQLTPRGPLHERLASALAARE